MKRLTCLCVVIAILCGCKASVTGQTQAMQLRDALYKCKTCSFTAVITADYTEEIYKFTMDCSVDAFGDMTFSVVEPDSLRGIVGHIRNAGADLLFENAILTFPTIADGFLSPVTAPWILLRGLRSGYFSAFAEEGDGILVEIDDSYQGQPFQIDVLLTNGTTPKNAQVIWKGRRILSVELENFAIV